jgi:Uma2 family endonuclease
MILPKRERRGEPELDMSLLQGERVTRYEFERRYNLMRDGKKAELIDGRVLLRPDLPFGTQRFNLIGWLGQYSALTPVSAGAAHSSIRADWGTELHPDACLFVSPEDTGCVQIDCEGFIDGTPELICDTVSHEDWAAKLDEYCRIDVKEYVVWRVLDDAIDWFVLEGARYKRLPCDAGIYRSRVFPGLWLDVEALIDGNLLRVFEVVQEGIASEEHRQFVARLQSTLRRSD